jgi:hypothetical protein
MFSTSSISMRAALSRPRMEESGEERREKSCLEKDREGLACVARMYGGVTQEMAKRAARTAITVKRRLMIERKREREERERERESVGDERMKG